MAELKERKIDSALLSKGFRKHENDHTWYLLYIHGRRTAIHTKLSHGSKGYDDRLLSIIKRQLKMPSLQFLKDYVDCTTNVDDYLAHLIDNEGMKFD